MDSDMGVRPDGKHVLGWREHVGIPAWGVRRIRAKVDTGARTSALHVENIVPLADDRIRFDVVLRRDAPGRRIPVETDVVRVTRIRSSSGDVEDRFVVSAPVRIGRVEKVIQMTLVNRRPMICRMLLGRSALEGTFLVDPENRYLAGRPHADNRPPSFPGGDVS